MTDAFVSFDPASSIIPLQHGEKVDVKITVTDRNLTVLPNNLLWEEILRFQFDDGSLFEVKVDVFISATVVPSELFPDKTGLIFTGTEHQTIVIQNQTSVDYSVSATPKQGWIKVSPANAVAKARNQPLTPLDVSVDPATAPLSSGLAQGSIEINFKDGSKHVFQRQTIIRAEL